MTNVKGTAAGDSEKSSVKTSAKPKIFVTRALSAPALEKLASVFDMSLNKEDRVLSKSEIIENVKDKDALLCLLTDTIDKSVFDAGTKLKVVSNYAVGFNNIDIQEANKRKIPVCITPGILTEATADLTWALILSVARRIVESDVYTRAGLFKGWAPDLFLGSEVHGKTLGIIGMGRIGKAVARRAQGFDMQVIYAGREGGNAAVQQAPDKTKDVKNGEKNCLENVRCVPLKELLQTADIISLHTPLTPDTRHLIGKNELALMKKTAYLINTTRGPVVDELALIEALQQGQIMGAGLDVYENEPELAPGLIELKNAVLLPHIGSATTETRHKMALLAVENAIAIFQGKPPHAIANPEVLGK